MINTELHAAGISDERLRESYRYCRRLNAEHGRTYFLATRLLTPSPRSNSLRNRQASSTSW